MRQMLFKWAIPFSNNSKCRLVQSVGPNNLYVLMGRKATKSMSMTKLLGVTSLVHGRLVAVVCLCDFSVA
jgi:hypothetical protein